MQKTRNRWNPLNVTERSLPFLLIVIALFLGASRFQQGEPVFLYSSDSLLVSADDYFLSDTLPYLVLVHEQGSSRGEFFPVVDRFRKMDLNCIAVDVRNGGDSRYFSNQTAKLARQEGYSLQREYVEADILAAVRYALEHSDREIILLGAGANASLCLKIGRESDSVDAVIAMSPGEFFRPSLSIQDTIAGLAKPIMVTATNLEFPYVEELVSGVEEQYKTLFQPENAEASRGSSALLPEDPASAEYWLAMLLFFKELK